MSTRRTATVSRKSAETQIDVAIDLEGGDQRVTTGMPFFDHMLTAFARHGRFGLTIDALGDLEIDAHHTVEDVGIVLGRAIREALGDRKGIERTGHAYMPMDETLIRAAFDLSGRPYLCFRVEIPGVYTPEIDLTVIEGFFRALCQEAGANLHVDSLQGRDYHHVVEATFKACGRALRNATRHDGTSRLPSTKELIDG
ncbi:MAG: imidazoleglycerol-phosphate dehydratase HisB [Polyangiales bacterium]